LASLHLLTQLLVAKALGFTLDGAQGEQVVIIALQQIVQSLSDSRRHVLIHNLRDPRVLALQHRTNKVLQRAVAGSDNAQGFKLVKCFSQKVDGLGRYGCRTQQFAGQFCGGCTVKGLIGTQCKNVLLNSGARFCDG
jgi:hypothetical protein